MLIFWAKCFYTLRHVKEIRNASVSSGSAVTPLQCASLDANWHILIALPVFLSPGWEKRFHGSLVGFWLPQGDPTPPLPPPPPGAVRHLPVIILKTASS